MFWFTLQIFIALFAPFAYKHFKNTKASYFELVGIITLLSICLSIFNITFSSISYLDEFQNLDYDEQMTEFKKNLDIVNNTIPSLIAKAEEFMWYLIFNEFIGLLGLLLLKLLDWIAKKNRIHDMYW